LAARTVIRTEGIWSALSGVEDEFTALRANDLRSALDS
jgi:hypothetical protein